MNYSVIFNGVNTIPSSIQINDMTDLSKLTDREILSSCDPSRESAQKVRINFPIIDFNVKSYDEQAVAQRNLLNYLQRREEVLYQWLDDNCEGEYMVSLTNDSIDFDEETDAILFYLTFKR